jgi:hypothetical protein
MENGVKKPWLSKTILFNILFALTALYPPVGDWMKAHVEIMMSVWSGLNVVLRLFTKDKISLGD